jgi:hypothetical protein
MFGVKDEDLEVPVIIFSILVMALIAFTALS